MLAATGMWGRGLSRWATPAPCVRVCAVSGGARTYATTKKDDGKKPEVVESRSMAKLRKKLEKKKVKTSASASVIDSILNPEVEQSKGVPPMSDFMPKLYPGGPKENKMNLMKFLERRQLVEAVKERKIPHFQPGSVVKIVYKEFMSAKKTLKVTGLVIAMGGDGLGKSFTVLMSLENEQFEMSFPVLDPTIVSITVMKYQRARLAKLYYMRDKGFKAITFSSAMEPIPPKDGKLGMFIPPRK